MTVADLLAKLELAKAQASNESRLDEFMKCRVVSQDTDEDFCHTTEDAYVVFEEKGLFLMIETESTNLDTDENEIFGYKEIKEV